MAHGVRTMPAVFPACQGHTTLPQQGSSVAVLGSRIGVGTVLAVFSACKAPTKTAKHGNFTASLGNRIDRRMLEQGYLVWHWGGRIYHRMAIFGNISGDFDECSKQQAW